MAGKFLSLEETARQLGVTVETVQQLVDRKKLFPMRDGATIKFKADDVERLADDLGDDIPKTDELDLDEPAPAQPQGTLSGLAVDEIAIGEALDVGDESFGALGSSASAASHTIVKGSAPVGSGVVGGEASGLSLPSISGASGADVVIGESAVGGAATDNEGLDLESIVSASSPSLAAQSGILGASGVVSETLEIDLNDAAGASGGLAVGSGAGLAMGSGATGAGLALSGALDSGLSLEDGAIEMSGIDLGGDEPAAGQPEDGTVLGGDDFELGGSGGDDDSASVVIAESESGDSSFFGQAMAGEGSSLGEESVGLPSSIASEALGIPSDLPSDMTFNAWQMAGLICCSLLLLFGGFIAYDLVRTIGSPESTSLANPLLDGMANVFGWR